MKAALLLQIATTFAALSLVAVGGANAVVPDIHRQVVDILGWMDNATFANLFAIAQAAPGPNVLVVSLIGWHMAGLAGLAVATIAMILPSGLLAFAAGRILNRLSGARWVTIVKAGLIPLATGLILASGVVMVRSAHQGSLTLAISAFAAIFVVACDYNPLWALSGGAIIGLAGWALGFQ
ncbi:chromate transporter [Telmatospirillum sp.]|uniref:chromate transporter n=1 Tax=Telmatospirillum sp. TaxID=2079197 RepID=UPI00284948C8|nr:chromate transporter [Telmatospirillum sp.]MDR3441343.1 chromate transporter [Telmatospirillum sp.]